MDQNYIEQNDIARKYMQGRLTPEEAADFEVYLMDKPELVEEMELDGLLDKHLEQTSSVKEKRTGFLFSWLSAGVLRYASVVVVAFGLGVLVNSQISFEDNENGAYELSSLGLIKTDYVSGVRGSGNQEPVLEFSLSSGIDTWILVLQPKVIRRGNYIVTAEYENSDVVFEELEFQISGSGDVLVPFSTTKLKSGFLKITYYPISHEAELEQFIIKILN